MTVCIGALCDAKDVQNTANIILCADTLITYTSAGVLLTSNPNGSKIFPLPFGLYCAIADDLTNSHVFVSKLIEEMRGLLPKGADFYDRVKLAIEHTGEYIRRWRLMEILAKRGISLDDYLHDKDLAMRAEIESEMADPELPVELIVAGFQDSRPLLFYNDGITTQEQTSLGFFAAGSGELLAICWLNFRQQTLFMSSQRTFFHVLEAKRFAERNPTVGRRTIALFMSPGHASSLDIDQTVPDVIKQWGEQFHVKFTEPLDKDEQHDVLFKHFKPLTSQR